jgi:hypothetical protein
LELPVLQSAPVFILIRYSCSIHCDNCGLSIHVSFARISYLYLCCLTNQLSLSKLIRSHQYKYQVLLCRVHPGKSLASSPGLSRATLTNLCKRLIIFITTTIVHVLLELSISTSDLLERLDISPVRHPTLDLISSTSCTVSSKWYPYSAERRRAQSIRTVPVPVLYRGNTYIILAA